VFVLLDGPAQTVSEENSRKTISPLLMERFYFQRDRER